MRRLHTMQMTHTDKVVVEILTHAGLAGTLTGKSTELDGRRTYYWQGDGPRPGLAALLFAAIGVDVVVTAATDGLAVLVPDYPTLPALPSPVRSKPKPPPLLAKPRPRVKLSFPAKPRLIPQPQPSPPPAEPEPRIDLSPLPAKPVMMPYELWQRLDLSQIESRAVGMTLEQAALALEAGSYRQVEALAKLARDLARHPGRYDHNGEAAAMVALGLATGQMKHVETARHIYRREPWPAARYNEALCGYILALRAEKRKKALELLEGAGNILDREPDWVYYRGRRRVEVLKAEIDRAVGQAVPVVYVPAGEGLRVRVGWKKGNNLNSECQPG